MLRRGRRPRASSLLRLLLHILILTRGSVVVFFVLLACHRNPPPPPTASTGVRDTSGPPTRSLCRESLMNRKRHCYRLLVGLRSIIDSRWAP
jgi:hypothetical protein